MSDVATVMGVMATVNHAFTLVKTLKDADTGLEVAETKFKMIELYGALSDVKVSVSDLKTELQAKDLMIKALTEELKFQKSMIIQHTMYYSVDGENTDGPFCNRCYDVDGKAVRLYETRPQSYTCRQCNSWYTKAQPRERTISVIQSSYNPWHDL